MEKQWRKYFLSSLIELFFRTLATIRTERAFTWLPKEWIEQNFICLTEWYGWMYSQIWVFAIRLILFQLEINLQHLHRAEIWNFTFCRRISVYMDCICNIFSWIEWYTLPTLYEAWQITIKVIGQLSNVRLRNTWSYRLLGLRGSIYIFLTFIRGIGQLPELQKPRKTRTICIILRQCVFLCHCDHFYTYLSLYYIKYYL